MREIPECNVGTGVLDGPLEKNYRFRTAREVGPYGVVSKK